MKKRIIYKLIASICITLTVLFFSNPFLFAENCKSSYEFRGMSCEDFKKNILNEDGLFITFKEKPQITGKGKYWEFDWSGISIILPATEYEHVYVKKKNNGSNELMLRTVDGAFIGLFINENEVFDDIFATTMIDNTEMIRSSDGIASTRTLFGGPVSMSDIMMIAYQNSPKNITCCKEFYVDEIGTAISLVLKGVGVSGLEAAYKGIGNYKGWITKTKAKRSVRYDLNILSEGRPDQILLVAYHFPDDKNYHDLPFMVGTSAKSGKSKQPGWLVALKRGLISNSENDWNEYIISAKRDGISEKSISRTVEELNLNYK